MTFVASCGSRRHSDHASGCVAHHFIVSLSGVAPGSVIRFASKVLKSSLFWVYAAEPKLSIEFGPGIGPSASMSVLTYISFMTFLCGKPHLPKQYTSFDICQ